MHKVDRPQFAATNLCQQPSYDSREQEGTEIVNVVKCKWCPYSSLIIIEPKSMTSAANM